jgi:hypothetical protein
VTTPSDPPDIHSEYQALLQFFHLAPVGLVQTALNGDIHLMNPKAAQLLAPLGFGLGVPNLFDILDQASADVRTLVGLFSESSGVVCENYRLDLLHLHRGGQRAAPEALGLTLLLLTTSPGTYMAVVTDETAAIKLQRLQATWTR